MSKFIIDKNNYFIGCGRDGTIPFTHKFNLSNLPSIYHKWNEKKQDFVLDEKNKAYLKSLLSEVYLKQDTLRDKMLKNDYKYKIKSPETYEQYKAEYDEEMKVLILQEDELKIAIDGK